jgi:hypothetical protein
LIVVVDCRFLLLIVDCRLSIVVVLWYLVCWVLLLFVVDHPERYRTSGSISSVVLWMRQQQNLLPKMTFCCANSSRDNDETKKIHFSFLYHSIVSCGRLHKSLMSHLHTDIFLHSLRQQHLLFSFWVFVQPTDIMYVVSAVGVFHQILRQRYFRSLMHANFLDVCTADWTTCCCLSCAGFYSAAAETTMHQLLFIVQIFERHLCLFSFSLICWRFCSPAAETTMVWLLSACCTFVQRTAGWTTSCCLILRDSNTSVAFSFPAYWKTHLLSFSWMYVLFLSHLLAFLFTSLAAETTSIQLFIAFW